MGHDDDAHGDYPPGLGDDIGTPNIDDTDVSDLYPTWGDITNAPVSHHYYAHRGNVEGHHHHGTDGSVLHHNHDGHGNHDHQLRHIDAWLHDDDAAYVYGPADHDHDHDVSDHPHLPTGASDVRT